MGDSLTNNSILNVLHEKRIFKAQKNINSTSISSFKHYKKMYNESVKNPGKFWEKHASIISWSKKWKKVLEWKPPHAKWYIKGKLNVCYNCLDRHIETRKNKAAIIWEGDNGSVRIYTYLHLFREVCKFANVLKKHGIKKGDRVCIYMPMIPEVIVAMLACARIGAIHNVVFGGFSAKSLNERINDSKAKILVCADGYMRGGKLIDMAASVIDALTDTKSIKSVIIVQNSRNVMKIIEGRDYYWHDEMDKVNADCKIEVMDSEDPLFILYTSGTTGKPKGVIHTSGGYLVYVSMTTKYIFDIQEDDTYWCTADIGWVTGHSYIVYGPLSLGATTIIFEGIPTYPNPDRFWEIVEKHRVSIFYTAPTAIRALEREGDEWPKKHNLNSLRILGSVGEPINPEAWMWYYKNIGHKKCPIVDTWWQTETGGIMITPLPWATPLKPGSATFPFFGIVPNIYLEDGSKAKANEGGYLVIEKPWPAMIRGIWGDKNKYKDTYYSRFPGVYFVGDSARRDLDGYYWILGRCDDVLNIAGHRIGTAEVESALVSHNTVAESAVVGVEDKIKGSALYAFVTLKKGHSPNSDLIDKLKQHVAKEIGPIAKPKYIQFSPALPKTRSGKIMRRILKKIANEDKDLGNITTLANPEVVKELMGNRLKLM